MRIATVSLDYYRQNSAAATRKVGAAIARRNLDFAGLTEVRSTAMRKGLRSGMGEHYALVGVGESPLAYHTGRWRLAGHRSVVGTEGVEDITPTLRLTIGTFVNRRSGADVVVIATHMVPLTLHGKPRPDYALRWRMWRGHWRKLKAAVAEAHAAGHTVFVIGDFNHSKAKRDLIKQVHPTAKWVIRKGLDWCFVVPGGARPYRLGLTRGFASGSDHRAWQRRVLLRKGA